MKYKIKFILVLAVLNNGCADKLGVSQAYGTGVGGSSCVSANGKLRVFNTSNAYEGISINGLAGADAICAATAISANMCGSFVAFLSDSSTDAISRISGNGPWYDSKQSILAFANASQLSSGPSTPINWDENGKTSAYTYRWTGSTLAGLSSPTTTCSNWGSGGGSGELGVVNSTPDWAGENDSTPCTNFEPILCFEI